MNERAERIIRQIWKKEYFGQSSIDAAVTPFLNLPAHSNWLKSARNASLLSIRQMASKMGIAANTYVRFEQDESTITLANLKKCAEAMDCELIYAIRPQQRVTFGDRVWGILRPYMDERDIERALQSLARLMYDPQFRRVQGWRRNTAAEAQIVARGLKESRANSHVRAFHPF